MAKVYGNCHSYFWPDMKKVYFFNTLMTDCTFSYSAAYYCVISLLNHRNENQQKALNLGRHP